MGCGEWVADLGVGVVGEVCLTGGGEGCYIGGELPHCFVHRI